MISLYVITAWLASTTAFCVGILVYLKNSKGDVNKRWAFMSLSITFWSLFLGFLFKSKDAESGLMYSQILMIGANLIPVAFYHFVLALLGQQKDKKARKLLLLGYSVTLFLIAINFTSLFIKSASYKILVKCFYPNAGPLFIVYILIYFWLLGYSCFLMYAATRTSLGFRRNQIRYVMVASIVGFLGGATTFPLWYQIPIPPFGSHFVWLYAVTVTIAIIRFRLMDIDLAWRYGLSHFFYALVSLSIFIPLIFLMRLPLTDSALIIFFGFLIAPYLYRKLIKFFQSTILGKKYSYWNELKSFWEKERIVFTSGQLADTLKEISEVMGLESFSFFLFEPFRKVFVPRAYQGLDGVFDPEQAEVLNTIYPDDPLVMYLEKEKRIITRDELVTQSKDDHQAVLLEMDELKALVSVPLFVAGRLTGILNLGTKKAQEMYHQEDMELIKQVLRFAERHLSHISFFDSSLIFSGSVAHDIRKPFRQGIIYGCLEDIKKGPLNPTQQEALDNLKERLVSLDDMSEDMVGAFKNLELFLKSGFKPQKIDYTRLINEESKSFKPMAEERKLTFEIDLPKREFFLYADPLSVQRILNELLTNAIKYTERGKITVKVSCENPEEVLTEVSDTGRGIAKEDQEEIWELFKRGENGQKKEGEGIGLAMVRQLVEANGGKISLNSSKGNGSNFFFTLPAWEDKERVINNG